MSKMQRHNLKYRCSHFQEMKINRGNIRWLEFEKILIQIRKLLKHALVQNSDSPFYSGNYVLRLLILPAQCQIGIGKIYPVVA